MSTMLETANTKKSFQFSLKQLAKKTASEVDRKMDCYFCYLNGSPWAPHNWLWWQCGLRVHRINGGSWEGASLDHIYGLPMQSDYCTSANLSISREVPSLCLRSYICLGPPKHTKVSGHGEFPLPSLLGYPKNITVEGWEVCLGVTLMGLELCGILWWNRFRAWK